jgi:hypothetical protein
VENGQRTVILSHLIADTSSNGPALGQYGWVWISVIGIGLWVAYKRMQHLHHKREARRRHDYLWGHREGESVEEWQSRVVKLRDDLERSRRAEELRKLRMKFDHKQRRYREPHRSHRDFDPPGGWGAMGPGE